MLLLLALLPVAYAALPDGYVVPNREESLGPVLRTGRYRVIQDRILGDENSYQAPPNPPNYEGPWLQGHDQIAADAERFHYQGPIDGRRVYIYRRVHTPVRVTNGVVERLGPGQTVDRWAEGGYKGTQNRNVQVYHRVGQDIYSDRVVPVKDGMLAGARAL
ncbi:hypothetical protein PMAYCL1PPCAC_31762 [Pristionchus mayeri]|uniref:Uncharacterized protein n=1 Tax=Pristionchus mayeri TaxID=1317129 RepID=A0AAN5DGD1_9BILA|nr:hypothetical protein PMAYCL1PPCAC_31762 [Pristionchus mayeri]